jgi:hypothetical protein
MSGAQQVSVKITTATAPAVTQQNFGVGAIVGYHTHYSDRQRTYTSPSAMVADGFTTTEPLYRAAQVYFEQTVAPSSLVIGRRANANTQTVNLVLTDTVSTDLYSLSVIGSDDVSHTVSFASTGVPSTDALTLASYFAANGGPVTHLPAGSTGPNITFTGVATANQTIVITITLGGARGTATFSWTLNGVTQQTGQATAATFSLTGTGLTAVFPNTSNYVLNDTYSVASIINCGTVSTNVSLVTFTQSTGKLTDFLQWQAGPVQNIQLTDVTADPGLTADLVAIYNANTLSFYGVSLDSNSKAEVLAAMAWVEGTGQGGKVGFFNNSDFQDVQTIATATDVFTTAQLLNYKKSFLVYSGQELLGYGGVSAMSYALAQNPGSYTLADKSLPGVLVDTDTTLPLTQALALNTMSTSQPGTGGKNGNYYAQNQGLNTLWPGVTPSGQYMDYTIWLDWVNTQIQAGVYAAKAGPPKLAYDDNGIGVIVLAVLSPLKLSATPAYNAVDPTSIVVTAPTAASVSAASRANRDLPGVSFSCRYTGAIQTVEVTGVVYF